MDYFEHLLKQLQYKHNLNSLPVKFAKTIPKALVHCNLSFVRI